jgi:lysophospholipase L1-like esterase
VRLIAIAILAALLAFAVACGGGDDDPQTSTSASPTRTSSRTPRSRTPTLTPGPTAAVTPQPTGPRFVTPTPRPTPTPLPDANAKLYVSLGDSLAYGNGASNRGTKGWVPLVFQGLGPGWALSNWGVPGYTSQELLDRELGPAIDQIVQRRDDGIPGNEAAAITLEIGGNDLLEIYEDLVLTGKCPSVAESLPKPECTDRLRSALLEFTPNLQEAVDRLQAASPGTPIFLATLYNPFSGGSENLDGIGALALEGQADTPFPTGLNDAVRAVAQEKGVNVVEWYAPFLGKVNEYISQDLIHPNDIGHRVMADVVLAAMAQAGVD